MQPAPPWFWSREVGKGVIQWLKLPLGIAQPASGPGKKAASEDCFRALRQCGRWWFEVGL